MCLVSQAQVKKVISLRKEGKKAQIVGAPKCIQFFEKSIERNWEGLVRNWRRRKVVWRFPMEAVPICPLSQSSRVRVLTVDFGAVVPETQELEDGTSRKVLDAARILNVE